jgi:glycolate oxidase FAD binding subunit
MTAGGMVAANLAGSRGIVCGGVGASVAGARVVSGDGEIITAGGAVGSGRTGLDLTRLVAGSMGTLGVIAEVTLRLAARPLRRATLVVHGLAGEIAVEAMGDVLAGCPGITGAIHLDGAMAAGLRESALAGNGPGGTGDALTLLRLEAACDAGLGLGVKRLTGLLETYGEVGELDDVSSDGVWDEIRRMGFIAPGEAAVWRIMVRPSRAAELVGGIRRYMMADAAYDWGGGVVWLVTPPAADAGASDVRRVTAAMGAVATLVRAGDAVRQSVDCFEPPEEGVAGLARRLKAAFDPAGILNPGRLYRGM